jgi:hypothetical protein
MLKINMIGGGFQHDVCSSALNKNKYVEWVKDGSTNISIHIDNSITDNIDKSKLNFGWLAESSSIIPNIITEVKSNLDKYKEKFKYIFTHDKRIVELDPDFFKFTLPNAMPWIKQKNIYEKNKLCSFIVSNKVMTDGHKFRLKVLNKYYNKVDHFGRGFDKTLPWTYNHNGIEESGKLFALQDYYFSFAFENDNYDSIFCEKITDCFVTGTIPIFWGTPNIGDYFDKNGIIIFDDNFNFDELTPELYYSKKESIKNNFQASIDLLSAEDYIYVNYIK